MLTCTRRDVARVTAVAEPVEAPVPPSTVPVEAQRVPIVVRTAQLISVEEDDLVFQLCGNLLLIVPAEPEGFHAEEAGAFEAFLPFVPVEVRLALFEGADCLE